jgi:hypothetical protein
MRAHEFLREAKKSGFHDDHLDAMHNISKMPAKNSDGYGMYRFGITMAGSPDDHASHKDGAIGETPMLMAYSKGEEDIIKHSAKIHGVGAPKATGKSREAADVHHTSPVAKRKRNRYGV